jgi:A/G-specific adenine glycosylase
VTPEKKQARRRKEKSGGGAQRRSNASGRDQRRISRIRSKLLDWYTINHRDLPWRRSRDPYAIWVSETMLQQTRVETVIPYYERFLERFPDVHSLADAEREDVFGLWAGLGYYSRARNLHDAAQIVADEHAGELPDETDALRALPGIGRYTAGALASIAFDQPEPVVDGNVVRVLTRIFGIREDVGGKAVIDGLWELAGDLARGPRPGDLNQALMELGATVCTPRGPRCDSCPLRRSCDAAKRGDAESLPLKAKKTRVRPAEACAAWILRGREGRGEKVLAVRRPEGGLLSELWELPGSALGRGADPEQSLREHVEQRLGLSLRDLDELGKVQHVFTHIRLRLRVFSCAAGSERVRRDGYTEHRWVSPSAFEQLPQATLTRKAAALRDRF